MKMWPPVRNRPPMILREFRGENKLDKFSIRDDQATESLNFTSDKAPALTVRPGFSVLGSFGKVLGMGVWKETELHVVTADGKWRRLNVNNTWTELASGLSTTAEWTFSNFKGNLPQISLIGSNGVDAVRVYDGTTVMNLSGAPAGAKYMTQFADRLWCAVGNEMHYSAYRMATDWTAANGDDADAGYIIIETPDGELINSIQSGLTKLTITKPSSVHTLFGYSPSDYTMRAATLDTGQFNHKSGVTLDGWLFQLYDSGFYRFPGSGLPENSFSERIREYLTGLTTAQKSASALGTDGRKLYLSVNGKVIEYDPKKDTYYAWQLNALQFAQVGQTLYIGDDTRILKLGGTTDGGAAISSKWVSKPFSGPSLAQGIRWLRMWLTVDLPAGSALNVYLSKSASGENWEQVGSVTATSDIQQKAIYVASSKVPNAKYIRFKIEGTGPYSVYEVAWEQESLPLR